VRECNWCGQKFLPKERHQQSCSHSCHMAYSNMPCDCDECRTEEDRINQAAELDGSYHGE
jgi:hypothetical protein